MRGLREDLRSLLHVSVLIEHVLEEVEVADEAASEVPCELDHVGVRLRAVHADSVEIVGHQLERLFLLLLLLRLSNW